MNPLGNKPIPVPKEVRDHIVRLYVALEWPISRISATVGGLSVDTLVRRLRSWGIALRPPGRGKAKCLECGKPTHGRYGGKGERCKLHRRLRTSELNREWDRRVNAIPEERWRA